MKPANVSGERASFTLRVLSREPLGTHGCSPRLNRDLHQRYTSRSYDYRLVIEEERRPWNFRNITSIAMSLLTNTTRTYFCFLYKTTCPSLWAR